MSNAALNLVITCLILVGFYNYFKGFIFKLAPTLAQKSSLIQHHPFTQVVGTIELAIVAVCHVIFCVSLLFIFKVDIRAVFLDVTVSDCFYGVLIGIGIVGVSILCCTLAIKIIETVAKDKAPNTLDGWFAISHAGWVRHHKHTIKILPVFFSLLIITLQIGSEETIFRCVLLHQFSPLGMQKAFFIATLLFVYMQTFHMPSLLSAMFPIIGATIMGIVHGLLYIDHPSMVPLILSHLTFFLFTVIQET